MAGIFSGKLICSPLQLFSFICIEHEMDGQSLVTLVDTGIQGPDCLRELIPKIGVRLKVYSYIIKDKEAQASQVSFYIHI